MAKSNAEILEDLYQAYVYAYPLVVLDVQIKAQTNTVEVSNEKAPINQLIHAKGLATCEDKYIVMLNMDTVYSQAYLDLKEKPLYFRKPKADRYVSAEIIDAYGNCVAILGTGGTGGNGAVDAALTGPDFRGEVPAELVRIKVPTNLAWILIRTLQNDPQTDPEDVGRVHEIQKGFDLRPLSSYGKEYQAPQGSYRTEYDYLPAEKLASLDVEEFFNRFNGLIADNPDQASPAALLESVRSFGIGAGALFQLSALPKELREPVSKFQSRLLADFEQASRNLQFSTNQDGWMIPKDNIANFGTDYLYRADIAYGGLGANPVSMAIYPSRVYDEQRRALHSDRKYRIHFPSEPPVDGFWSITVYGDDKFQIPNELNRSGLNDRSPIVKNEDGSFDIYIQRDRPEEGRVPNWLPSGERGIVVVLRLYLPRTELLDGTWKLPTLTTEES